MHTLNKKLIALLMVIVMVIMTPLVCFAAKSVTLDVSKYKSMKSKPILMEKRVLGSGSMTYHIPTSWKGVEDRLDNIDGYGYRLNEIENQTRPDAEQLYLFYFSYERYLADQADASKREKIEQAIIKNILPDEDFSPFNTNILDWVFPTESKLINKGGFLSLVRYDYYDTTYTDRNRKVHNAEFVFLPNGSKGMCCALYIYTDSVHKDEIIAVLHEIETSQ